MKTPIVQKPLFAEDCPKIEVETSIFEKIKFTGREINLGKFILEEESVYPVNRENAYPAGLYWLYSSRQDHHMQKLMFSEFKNWGLLKPEIILDNHNSQKLKRITSKANYDDQKRKRMMEFTELWLDPDSEESKVIDEIIIDANNGHSRGIELREKLAKYAPGLGQKCASCFMIALGYREGIVPVDTHVLHFLQDLGYYIKPLMDEVERSPSKKEYLLYEGHMCDLAKHYKMDSALYQAIVWAMRSGYSGMYYQKTIDAEFPAYQLPKEFYIGETKNLGKSNVPAQVTFDNF